MEQRTEQWHEFRRNHIGASDAPIIMGVSPWKTIEQLWEEKALGLVKDFDNPWMKRGREMEDEARNLYEFFTNRYVPPCVLEHPQYKFLSASFDGLSPLGNFACEIKCPGKKDHQKALDGQIPEKYYPQLQHQMFVGNLDCMDYFSYDGSTHVIIPVERDQEYIVMMLEKEIAFWSLVESKTRPSEEFLELCKLS